MTVVLDGEIMTRDPQLVHPPFCVCRGWGGIHRINNDGTSTYEECPKTVHPEFRKFLRLLVDESWNECTESEEVPSTNWADRIIDRTWKDFYESGKMGSRI